MHVDDYESKAAGSTVSGSQRASAPPVPPPRPPPGIPKPGPPKVYSQPPFTLASLFHNHQSSREAQWHPTYGLLLHTDICREGLAHMILKAK